MNRRFKWKCFLKYLVVPESTCESGDVNAYRPKAWQQTKAYFWASMGICLTYALSLLQ